MTPSSWFCGLLLHYSVYANSCWQPEEPAHWKQYRARGWVDLHIDCSQISFWIPLSTAPEVIGAVTSPFTLRLAKAKSKGESAERINAGSELRSSACKTHHPTITETKSLVYPGDTVASILEDLWENRDSTLFYPQVLHLTSLPQASHYRKWNSSL